MKLRIAAGIALGLAMVIGCSKKDGVLKECDAILAALHTSGVKAAFKKIRELSPVPDSELEPMEKQTAQQLAALEPRFGKIIGFERVRVEAKGQSVLECIYITKCERHILRWRFYFYRPKDKWFLNAFFWDNEIEVL